MIVKVKMPIQIRITPTAELLVKENVLCMPIKYDMQKQRIDLYIIGEGIEFTMSLDEFKTLTEETEGV